MAVQVNVWGLTLVKFAGNNIGYTRNGVDITKEGFFLDVAGDEFGGDDGPPIDVQYLGELVRVRCELTKFDPDNAKRIYRRKDTNALGEFTNVPGSTLMNQDAQAAELVLNSNGVDHYTFKNAFPRAPIEINKGTKFSTLVCEFECHGWYTNNSVYTYA